MRLDQYLYIDGVEYGLIDADIALSLNGAGLARFKIRANLPPPDNAIIRFSLDYQPNPPAPYFTGYISKMTRNGSKAYVLQCRELNHALTLPCFVSLRDCTLGDVLAQITNATALKFDCPHSATRAPRFQNHADGVQALALVPRVFKINDCISQLAPDGSSIYLGDWSQSRWASRAIEVEPELFETESGGDRASIAYLPHVRPGTQINGRRVQSTRFTNDRLKITWTT